LTYPALQRAGVADIAVNPAKIQPGGRPRPQKPSLFDRHQRQITARNSEQEQRKTASKRYHEKYPLKSGSAATIFTFKALCIMPSWQLSGPHVRSSLAFPLNEATQSKFLLSTLSATWPPPLERQDLPRTVISAVRLPTERLRIFLGSGHPASSGYPPWALCRLGAKPEPNLKAGT
jgi:hypothetical protein